MANKNLVYIVGIVALVAIVGIILVFMGHGAQNTTQTTTIAAKGTGAKTIFTYSDAGVSGVSSVNMQVQSVQMQNSATGQWYTAAMVSNGGNLKLQGQGSYTLVGNVSVPAGTYSAVQMNVQSATAAYANGTTKPIIMPNSTVRMVGTFNVQSTANTSSTNWINFDIKSNQSLHSTTSGQLVFFPVVEVVAWSNAQLSSGANNTVNVQNSGTVTADQSAGMNINGQMQSNFVLPLTTNITVSATGVITVSGITGTGQTSVQQIVITDPAQFPKGTQAAVITYLANTSRD